MGHLGGVPRVFSIELSLEGDYDREIVAGVHRYVRQLQSREILLILGGRNEKPPDIRTSDMELGVITMLVRPADVLRVRREGVALVNVSGQLRHPQIVSVLPDDKAAGILAAEHLLERGFQDFAAFSCEGHCFRDRVAAFVRRVREAGHRCLVCPDRRSVDYAASVRRTAEMLIPLPKPLGIMCCTDTIGRSVIDACRLADLGVPEHVAVIGVDNAALIGGICSPPLTSVDINGHEIGYQAARLLDRMLDGERDLPLINRVPVLPVVARASTDTLAVSDPEVMTALRFIRERCCDAIGVDDVLDKVNVSRRSLEYRMRRAIGHTPGQEIRAARIAQVERLLMSTDWQMSKIAHALQFPDQAALCNAFQAARGCTPTDFRRRHRRI